MSAEKIATPGQSQSANLGAAKYTGEVGLNQASIEENLQTLGVALDSYNKMLDTLEVLVDGLIGPEAQVATPSPPTESPTPNNVRDLLASRWCWLEQNNNRFRYLLSRFESA